MLYSSSQAPEHPLSADANSYLPFKTVDSTVVNKIMTELDALDANSERLPSSIVGALTKALCCKSFLNDPVHTYYILQQRRQSPYH